MEIRRCRHIKVNGTQCGSPALRARCYCYFHNTWRNLGTYGDPQHGLHDPYKGRFPVLEDANSVQAALMQVIRLMLAKEIKAKEAGLLLYALQIASSNLKNMQLEPFSREDIVVDPLLVGHSPLDGYPARQEDLEEAEESSPESGVGSQRIEEPLTSESRASESQVSQNQGDLGHSADPYEEYLEKSRVKADAQWEDEARRELEESSQESVVRSQRIEETLTSDSHASESQVSQNQEDLRHPANGDRDTAPNLANLARRLRGIANPELRQKIYEAGARYLAHPQDKELARAYAELCAAVNEHTPQHDGS